MALRSRPAQSATDVIVSVVVGTALLIGLAYAAIGKDSSTSSTAYTAHTYCTRDVRDVRSLWEQSPDATVPAAHTMSIHAIGLGDPYASHAQTLDTTISAAQEARVEGRLSAPIEAAVSRAWAEVMHDCHR